MLSEDADQNRVVDEESGPQIFGTELYPAGGAELLDLEPDLGAYSYVSADLDDVDSRDNAFGLFITSADGVDIRNSTFENNLVDGLVLHRGVTNTVVHNTTASHNAVDGISVTRAATGVVLDRITAEQNGRNGITLEGGPLADGPSATGTPTGSYGNNQVSDSVASGNGRYGIEVVGGTGHRARRQLGERSGDGHRRGDETSPPSRSATTSSKEQQSTRSPCATG